MRVTLALAALALVAALAACDGDDGPEPRPTPERTPVAAPIDALELIVRESQPPQYAVKITSGLPNGCMEFREARMTQRSAGTFTIEVTNWQPTDPNIACTQEYRTHETTVELGSGLTPGADYVVRANDEELRFTAQ